MSTLLDAVKDRDREKVRLLLEDGANVNEKDGSGRTPLYFSAQKGLVDITRLLLSYGAMAGQQTHWGSTPLHVAADMGFEGMLRELTMTGASLNSQNKNGDTALHLAAYRGKIGAVRILVEEGASVLGVNNEGRTPLQDAEVNGHEEVVTYLRQATEAQTRQAERLMAAQPQFHQHWKPTARPRPQQPLHPHHIEPHRSPTFNHWSPNPHIQQLQQQQTYPQLMSQHSPRPRSPVVQQPLNMQQAAMLQHFTPNHFPILDDVISPHNWPMQQPIHHQRFPGAMALNSTEIRHGYVQQQSSLEDPAVRPMLGLGLLNSVSSQQPAAQSPWQHAQPDLNRVPLRMTESLRQSDMSSLSSEQSSMAVEKADIELNEDSVDGQRRVLEYRRQQSENSQLEYKNRMLNKTLETQMERLTDIEKLEEKNKALMDELSKTREEYDELMKQYNDLVRERANVAVQEQEADSFPKDSERQDSICRPSTPSLVEISGERLSEVASAVITGDGSLPQGVQERLLSLILSDISQCSGISYLNNEDEVHCGIGHLPAVKGDSLCEEGLEWVYNVDYWLREDEPLNRPKDGVREGACSLVFRIQHKRHGNLILKVMINLINMFSAGHGSGQSMTAFLSGQFGAEHEVPLQLPKHPNVIQILHHFHGSTRPFNQFLRYMIPPHFDVHLEQANKTTFMVMKEYASTLSFYASQMKEASPTPPYGFEQDYLLCLLFQLASAINHLLKYGICHRDIKADNVFLDDSHWKVVLADFGLARTLYRGGTISGKPIQFVEPGQMVAGNSNAWAPEIMKYFKEGPPSDQDLFLPEIYAKTDIYGLGRMIYLLLCQPGDSLPSGSGSYAVTDLPALPPTFSLNLRQMLEGMVCYDSSERLTARDVEVFSGLLLFGPCVWELTTEQACCRWRSQLIFKNSLESGNQKEEGKDRVMKELVSRLLFTTSPAEVHQYVNKFKL